MKLNSVRFFAEGPNQVRAFTLLTREGIKLYDIERVSVRKSRFTVSKKNTPKTIAVLEKLCYNYTVEKRSDFKAAMSAAALRSGLIAGLIVFTLFSGLFYRFLWRVEISGNERTDALTIERALEAAGIGRGTPLSSLDRQRARAAVNALDTVLETSVEVAGTTLKITVVENTLYTPPQKAYTTDILSLYDASVTRIITASGTALVNIGERVFKGEPLIGARYTDQSGGVLPSLASGRVYGAVSFTESVLFSPKEYKLIRTGKTYVKTAYGLFGLNVFAGAADCGFKNFETETKEIKPYKNNFLPLKMTQTVYYEVAEAVIEHDLNERAAELCAVMADGMLIKAGAAEVEKTFTVKADKDGLYRLTVFLTAEMLIGGE